MVKTCYLHIGLHKTGTTSIQQSIRLNEEALTDLGFYIPEAGRVGVDGIHYGIAWSLMSGHINHKTYRGAYLELVDEIDKCDQEQVVVSSEDFCILDDEEVIKLRDYLDPVTDVRVMIYLRNPADWIISRWNQLIKQGMEVKGIDAYAQSFCLTLTQGQIYEDVVNRWARAFGDTAITIKLYDDIIGEGMRLTDDFWQTLGISADAIDTFEEPERSNVSVSYPFVEFFRRLNSDLHPS
ncbi:MAG: sulfotransferase domain-containing protein, partial [Chloroflexota bacterium]